MLKYIVIIVLTLSIVDCEAQSNKISRFGVHLGFGYQEGIVNIKSITPIYFDNYDIGINSFNGLHSDIGLLIKFKKQEIGVAARFCFLREETAIDLPEKNVVRFIPHAFWVNYFGGSGGELFRGGATFTYVPYHYIVNQMPGADPNQPPPVNDRGAYAAFGGIIGIRVFKKGFLKNTYANFNLQFALPNEFDKATSVNPGLQYNTTIGLSKPIYFKQKSK